MLWCSNLKKFITGVTDKEAQGFYGPPDCSAQHFQGGPSVLNQLGILPIQPKILRNLTKPMFASWKAVISTSDCPI